MKNLISSILCLVALSGFAQTSTVPAGWEATAFRNADLPVTIIMPSVYAIPSLNVEVWNNGVKLSDSTDVTVSGDTVKFTLTKNQIAPFTKESYAFLTTKVGLDTLYLLGVKVTVKFGVGIPTGTTKTISLPNVGNVRVSVVPDVSTSLQAAAAASSSATIAAAARDSANIILGQTASTLTGRLKIGSRTQLRSDADNPEAYQVREGGRSGFFYYDPSDATSPDDSVKVIRNGTRRYKRELTDPRPEFAGATGDSLTDDTQAFVEILRKYNGVLIDGKVYTVASMTFAAGKTVTFINGGRLNIKLSAQVKFRSRINASPDAWIFSCEDNPTNYDNENTPTYTAKPLQLNDTTFLASNATTGVHLKWFGAKGNGYKPTVVGAYYGTLTVPSTEWHNDTKAFRFALSAIGEGSHMTDHGASAHGGANTLFIPKGNFLVNEVLYVSSGTFIQGVGSSQNLGSMIVQMNPSKTLFVLQSAGTGGRGGSGSCHNFYDLSIGSRPTVGGLGTTNAYLIHFQDNKHNLDSRFFRLRISNCPVGGAVFYANDKEARYSGLIGSGSKRGLRVTFHVYESMFDVVEGDVVRCGPNGTIGARFYDSQFFNVLGAIVNNPAKTISNIETLDCLSFYDFHDSNFEGVGVAGEQSFLISDQYATVKIADCEIESRTVDGNALGAPIRVSRAKTLVIQGSSFTMNSTENNGGLYFLNLTGAIDNVIIKGNLFRKLNPEPAVLLFNFPSTFTSPNLSISDNTFYAIPTTNYMIYSESSATAPFGVIANNTFSQTVQAPIQGAMHPGIILQGNVFARAQPPMGTALANYNMSGRSVTYSATAPTTGYHAAGDKVINSSPSSGQPKGWICTVSGTPGTFISEGNL